MQNEKRKGKEEKEMNLATDIIPCTKINSKLFTDLM